MLLNFFPKLDEEYMSSLTALKSNSIFGIHFPDKNTQVLENKQNS